ncbi:hypothetical protein VF21_07462 [Pseudogymnoascus sp. 05NY08]|nr:hypothetical protein VF21_07462 [Pseudogymnoascus sp. 05NY08]
MAERIQKLASHLNYPTGMLARQTAIITGSGHGIGAECARLFANEGARVVVCDVDIAKSNEVAKSVNNVCPDRAISFPGDITDQNYFPTLVKQAADFGSGKIHIIDGVIHKMLDEQWDTILAVHSTASFRLIKHAAPYFRVKDGEKRVIVNVCSTSGTHGNVGQFGVRANTVAFAHINTRLTRAKENGDFIVTPEGERVPLGIPVAQLEARKGVSSESQYKDIPLGRPGTATEGAGSILAVCSPLFAYVSGQTIEVTGGRNM